MNWVCFKVACVFFTTFLLVSSGINVVGQVQPTAANAESPVELQEILSKLTFTSRINHSFKELNSQLAKVVQQRGVNFIVTTEIRQSIRKAGGNDELILAIDTAPKPMGVMLVDEENQLYNVILTNYKSSDPWRLQKAIDAAKEFLRRFGDYPRVKSQLDWIKPKIPIWERKFQTSF